MWCLLDARLVPKEYLKNISNYGKNKESSKG